MPRTSGLVSAQPSDSYNPTAMVVDGEQHEEEGACTEANAQRDTSPVSTNAVSEGETKTGKKRDLSEYNLDGLKCPICMELWTSQGDHQVCCLPCGHIFGFSCINRWIQHRGRHSAKCPQCNANINMKEVTRLYASPVIVVDENSHKKIESLEAENSRLKTERANLIGLQDSLLKELGNLKEELAFGASVGMGRNGFITPEVLQKGESGLKFGTNISRWGSFHCKFVLELEMAVDKVRLFDMDAYYQTLIIARRISGMGGTHMLNKINLINPNENEDIELPPSMKAVKDLRVSPCGRLALLASLGKKLSILSMGGNNVIISYDLPAPAWSCSWDLNSSHYMYAGLQSGKLLVFDMRQTLHPVKSIDGLTTQPIHTIHSFEHNPALSHISTRLLTASSIGPCVWNTSSARERPFLVPELENQGRCISLAYSSSSDDILATYRPRLPISNETGSSQPPSLAAHEQGTLCSQILVKRVAGSFYHKLASTSAHVGDVLLTKSAIVNVENCFPLFACANDVTHGLRLQELPSLTVSQALKPHQNPILDVKYAQSHSSSILGCISEDKLQLFSAKIS